MEKSEKERKREVGASVNSPSEYFVSLLYFACVFPNPTVNMSGKWQREAERDPHEASLLVALASRSRKTFWGQKRKKEIKGAKLKLQI